MGEHEEAGSGLTRGAAGSHQNGGARVARDAAAARLRDLLTDSGRSPAADRRTRVVPRSVDDEPALLVYDSDLDAGLQRAVRQGARSSRQLTFRAHGLQLEVELAADGQLVGQIVPPGPALVELRHRAGTASLAADELGSFWIHSIPEGPVSFRCSPEGSGEASFATSWVKL